jgi:sporulation protein YlmC with PRC-barrel domain
MQTSQRRLLGLPVSTRSGYRLGKLTDFIIDSDSGRISFILVRTRGLIPGLMDNELRIAWQQVISFGEKEIIVTDGSAESRATRLAKWVVTPSVQQASAEE